MSATAHEPVLVDAVLEGLRLRRDGIYVDCTFGRGGHTRAMLERLGERGRVLAIDRDPEAVAAAMTLAGADPRLRAVHGRFGELAALAAGAGFGAGVDGIVIDLGVSSPQLQAPERGFSFAADGPLDMRMDPQAGVAASVWLARAREHEIADVLYRFGEERRSRRIARAIVEARRRAPITRTAELAALVARALAGGRGRIHPATRTFQAIRMYVNDEPGELARVLGQAADLLRGGGRLAVISFHSLEDRLVKRFVRDEARCTPPRLRPIGALVRPDEVELRRNPRSRSARLRVAERVS